jgi:PAS domain S-box-containing protein
LFIFATMLHTDLIIQHMLSHAMYQIKDISIALLNVQGIFIFWNMGARLLDGYEEDEIIGRPLNTLHPVIEKKENLSEYMLSTAQKEGRVKHIGRRLKKDGSVYLASVVLNAVVDDEGKHIGYVRIAEELKK